MLLFLVAIFNVLENTNAKSTLKNVVFFPSTFIMLDFYRSRVGKYKWMGTQDE